MTGHGLYGGRPLFCDATVRSPLTGQGEPHPRAATDDGAVLTRALQDKNKKYYDVASGSLGELVVLAVETGGRWHDTALDLVRLLAKRKVRSVHPLLQRSAELAWADRWWALLGCAVQNAVAGSLLARTGKRLVLDEGAADAPPLDLLLDGQRWAA